MWRDRHHFQGAPVVATKAPTAQIALTAIIFARNFITTAFLAIAVVTTFVGQRLLPPWRTLSPGGQPR
jgi:hypothetical protein